MAEDTEAQMQGIDTLDTVRLQHYLAGKIENFPLTVSASKFQGGQSNPTFVLEDTTGKNGSGNSETCLLYTSPSPRDQRGSRMPSSA